jgi:hypothetical protein
LVALDNSDVLDTPLSFGRVHFSLAGFIATACALLLLITLAAHGFDENGLRLGSEMAWRFTAFAFFAALVAGPLARLLPIAPLQYFGTRRRQLLWGFCASFAVYLASLVIPNTIRPVTVMHEGLTTGMLVFVAVGTVLIMAIAYSISRNAARFLGESVRRAILTVGMAYFWLVYALTALARIEGPHRPEIFYGLSLSLMVLALLFRFADRFVHKLKRRESTELSAL